MQISAISAAARLQRRPFTDRNIGIEKTVMFFCCFSGVLGGESVCFGAAVGLPLRLPPDFMREK